MQRSKVKRLALEWTHAIPNGFHRSPAARGKAKREGVTSGILDLCIPSPELKGGVRGSGIYHGLYIEMKRAGRKLHENQSQFMDYLDLVHYRNELCYTWQSAARLIREHLDLKKSAEIVGEGEDDREYVKDLLIQAAKIRRKKLSPTVPAKASKTVKRRRGKNKRTPE